MPPFRDEFLARFRWIDGHADVLGLLSDALFLRSAVDALAAPFMERGITKVASVEARGFVIGGAVAVRLGAGFVAIRKPGAIFPGAKVERVTDPDWRGRAHALQIQRAALGAGDVVLLVDDWAELGSQALAAKALVEGCDASYAGLTLLVDELREDVRRRLAPVHAIVTGAELPRS
jgi:adenine phosphoribosyltransferase